MTLRIVSEVKGWPMGGKDVYLYEVGPRRLIRLLGRGSNVWFPPFRCPAAVAVSPFPLGLRKFRKNYVAYVKHSVAPSLLPPAVAP